MGHNDPVTLILGGSSGLGLELARGVAMSGQRVLIASRSTARLAEAEAKIAASAGADKVHSVQCDVGHMDDVERASARASDMGSLTTIIMSAGNGWFGSIRDLSPNAVQEVLSSNLHGMVHAGMLAARLSATGNLKTFVGVLSTAAYQTRDAEALYSAAKWGARAFLDGLRKELRRDGCRVVAVSPGGMRTRFWDRQPPPAGALESFLDPIEVAHVILANLKADGPLVSELQITRP